MLKSHLAVSVLLPVLTVACTASEDLAETAAPLASFELDGVWTIQNIKLESGEFAGSHTFDVQPSMFAFTDSHYSIVAVSGFGPRGFIANEPTNEEIARTFSAFLGHFGTYSLNEDELSLSPMVSNDPAQHSGDAVITYGVRWSEDGDLFLETTSEANGLETVRLTRVVEDGLDLSPAQQRFQGVWQRVERVFGTGEDAEVHIEDMQPGYYIFEGDKFAANFIGDFEPRTPLTESYTVDEYADAVGSYRSYAGRFSVFDDELTLWPSVSINPNNMRGRPFQPLRLEWEGDDVWMIYPTSYGLETRTRITRVPD